MRNDAGSPFVLLLCLVWLVGCSEPVRTKAEVFREAQSVTVLPHGKVDLESVRETETGVTYRTTDGSRWQVTMEQSADGTWRYSDLREMPEEE